MRFKRIFLVILDSIGVGEAADALTYQDQGVNTLEHVRENINFLVPNLENLGFLNTLNMSDKEGVEAYYTIARPNNYGKDTLSSYYELFGITTLNTFRDFSKNGFPVELINTIEQITNYRIIGNKVVGDPLKLINELGERHLNYGSIILYTSSDSTIEIAAHEDKINVKDLFEAAEKIRYFTEKSENYKVARIIARTFRGTKNGEFEFTNDYKCFSLKPPRPPYTAKLLESDLSVISIGKVSDIFNEEGIGKIIRGDRSNVNTINKLMDIMEKEFSGLCILSLDEFDRAAKMKNIGEYANLLEEFDIEIPLIINKLEKDDLLIITSPRGNDLTKEGIAHTRENVPVIIYGRKLQDPKKLEILDSTGDIAATICDNFDIEDNIFGKSFLDKLK